MKLDHLLSVRPTLAACLALLTLAGCTAAREARLTELDPFEQVRYRCEHEVSGANGVARSERLLDASGRQIHARADWDSGYAGGADAAASPWWLLARQGESPGPWLTAAWFGEGEGDLQLDRGWLTIRQHIRNPAGPRARSFSVRLELRSNLEIMAWANGGFGSPFSPPDENFRLQLDWSEASALARGADRLFLVAYDRQQNIANRVELAPALFARAAGDVATTITRSREMAANHLRECQYLEDGEEPEVIVT